MVQSQIRCLILACGNSLRADDGVGPWLAAWTEAHYCGDPGVRVISRQQWTPELAEVIARAARVIFIDCSIDLTPGEVKLLPLKSVRDGADLPTHHTSPAHLLALACDLYGGLTSSSLLLTIGPESTELGEVFSPPVEAALPQACAALERLICLPDDLPASANQPRVLFSTE